MCAFCLFVFFFPHSGERIKILIYPDSLPNVLDACGLACVASVPVRFWGKENPEISGYMWKGP